jgi:hypothetical protein
VILANHDEWTRCVFLDNLLSKGNAMNKFKLILFSAMLLLLTLACGQTSTPNPSPTSTPSQVYPSKEIQQSTPVPQPTLTPVDPVQTITRPSDNTPISNDQKATPAATSAYRQNPSPTVTPTQPPFVPSPTAIHTQPQEIKQTMTPNEAMAMVQKNPELCNNPTGMMVTLCEVMASRDIGDTPGSNQTREHRQGDRMAPPANTNQPDYSLVDPNNPPRIATHNFIDLDPYIGISKLRSAYGHDYSAGDDEHDPEGKSCRSMKHYFDAYTVEQRWAGSFGSYDTKGNVKFYAPADGLLTQIMSNEISVGTEYQFMIQVTQYPTIMFGFHHVDLLQELRSGGSVVAGQHLGYIARPHGQGEIATLVMVGNGKSEYISFFDIVTDEVFAMYQARGIKSRAEMSITKEERDANPIPCDTDFEQGAKFITQGDAATFSKWQTGPDNWVWLPQ